ncbi:MAG TPA: AraC family transcriptional regulator [Stellaceae bacterium]|nr:AraC family transcriptional regulator [Stellaceae bacterium]
MSRIETLEAIDRHCRTRFDDNDVGIRSCAADMPPGAVSARGVPRKRFALDDIDACDGDPDARSAAAPPTSPGNVAIKPAGIVSREVAVWRGATAEIVQLTRKVRFEFEARLPTHLLIAAGCSKRTDGETIIDDLPPSCMRTATGKLIFVPAGQRLRGWSDPARLERWFCFSLDPRGPLLDPRLGFGGQEFKPRLFFEDAEIWASCVRLASLVNLPGTYTRLYADALVAVLAHQLVRLQLGVEPARPELVGGLAGWQRSRVVDYIDARLAEPISLGELAGLVRLSSFHFARAFKRSFGAPPHRYHVERRIERAKTLLANPALNITDIAFRVGYSETGAFGAAFRRITGRTPTSYRRSLE